MNEEFDALKQLMVLLDKYQTNVVPKAAGPVQRKETTNAYMAGAISMFHIMTGPLSALPEEAAIAQLGDLKAHFEKYVADLPSS